ncbi:MAG: sulfur carrier protein ThiS [Hyphomicrobium sp.]
MLKSQKPYRTTRADFEIGVYVNGLSVTTSAQLLSELVAEHDLGPAKVATALNGAFVSVRDRSVTQIAAGDRIEIVTPRQGG